MTIKQRNIIPNLYPIPSTYYSISNAVTLRDGVNIIILNRIRKARRLKKSTRVKLGYTDILL